eukprot:TRINITY_DN8423_c0_g2_i1.p1 TRINITY_DN8423_c0_g2~~TRINITY_DN8423_c0_g2_i1.p1  ORF type:complete len:151 (+),score=7.89 TRINITY_DN8423_c0_g2_i1:350-802(+)
MYLGRQFNSPSSSLSPLSSLHSPLLPSFSLLPTLSFSLRKPVISFVTCCPVLLSHSLCAFVLLLHSPPPSRCEKRADYLPHLCFLSPSLPVSRLPLLHTIGRLPLPGVAPNALPYNMLFPTSLIFPLALTGSFLPRAPPSTNFVVPVYIS